MSLELAAARRRGGRYSRSYTKLIIVSPPWRSMCCSCRADSVGGAADSSWMVQCLMPKSTAAKSVALRMILSALVEGSVSKDNLQSSGNVYIFKSLFVCVLFVYILCNIYILIGI